MGFLQRAKLTAESNVRALLAAPYTQLLIASDAAGWVLDEEARELIRLAGKEGIQAYRAYRPLSRLRQCVHYTSLFSLADPAVFASNHRISVDYFHGKPDQDPAFAKVFETMKKHSAQIGRIRLSYSGMYDLARATGVPDEKIQRIPIGINPDYFRFQTPELRRQRRQALGIPPSAVVVGSFQKDGQGWGEGLEPKWVKGPDIFVRTLARLKEKVPELFVLLSGPSRGYVKREVEKLGIPYKHLFFSRYEEVGALYEALDLYVVASREEGGPKAVLESMVAGVPLVTTRVGQAIDLVRHGENGYLAEVEDAEALAHFAEKYLADSSGRRSMLERARADGLRESYDAQLPRWREYFSNLVERGQ